MSIALFLMAAVSQNVTAKQAYTFGVGRYSCARAWTPAVENYSYNWTMGFFTALNIEKNGMVGSNTDGDGIVGEVKRLCEAYPSMKLEIAVFTIYHRMAQPKR